MKKAAVPGSGKPCAAGFGFARRQQSDAFRYASAGDVYASLRFPDEPDHGIAFALSKVNDVGPASCQFIRNVGRRQRMNLDRPVGAEASQHSGTGASKLRIECWLECDPKEAVVRRRNRRGHKTTRRRLRMHLTVVDHTDGAGAGIDHRKISVCIRSDTVRAEERWLQPRGGAGPTRADTADARQRRTDRISIANRVFREPYRSVREGCDPVRNGVRQGGAHGHFSVASNVQELSRRCLADPDASVARHGQRSRHG